jgi:hypothetical protein
MYQVATHSAAYDSHKTPHANYHRRETTTSVTKLPRTLERPGAAEISKACIAAASPECADVPVDNIKAMLLQRAKS